MCFFLRCRHCKKPWFFCKVETHFTTTSRILLPCLLRQPFFFLVLSRRYYAVSFALKIASSLVSSKRPPVNLKDCRPLTCVLISYRSASWFDIICFLVCSLNCKYFMRSAWRRLYLSYQISSGSSAVSKNWFQPISQLFIVDSRSRFQPPIERTRPISQLKVKILTNS